MSSASCSRRRDGCRWAIAACSIWGAVTAPCWPGSRATERARIASSGSTCGRTRWPRRGRAARRASSVCASATALPHPDSSFDLILAFTLFSSILDDRIAGGVAREIGRVLRPGGALVWYDVRVSNPHNPAVRGMPRRRLLALFPGWRATLRPITLLPPVARRLGRLTGVAYPALAALPPLRTHWAGLLERPR